MRVPALLASLTLALSATTGCYLGPSRAQRTTSHVLNGVLATLGAAGIVVTAIDRSRTQTTMIQIHPDLYIPGGVLLGCAVIGTVLNLTVGASPPKPPATAALARTP